MGMRGGGNPSMWEEVSGPQKEVGPTSKRIPSLWPAALSTPVYLEAPIRKRQGWGNSQDILSSVVRVVCGSMRSKKQALRDLTSTSEWKACS